MPAIRFQILFRVLVDEAYFFVAATSSNHPCVATGRVVLSLLYVSMVPGLRYSQLSKCSVFLAFHQDPQWHKQYLMVVGKIL